LRRELRAHRVAVVAVEPGAVATPIWAKGIAGGDAVTARMNAAQRERYGAMIAAVRRQAQRNDRDGIAPAQVAGAVEAALTSSRPRTRYLVGRDARVQAALGRLLPDRVMDALVARALR
jgi:NAD(P)-dependent dehydrogenase (short-subunit alcohol dehydrogenase family)